MHTLNGLNRLHAFGLHLVLSSVVAILSAALVFLFWYPGVISYASGVGEIFFLLVAVDVVLGPIITLIVFNTKKKDLRRDLAIVVVLQLAALLCGLHAVWVARPVYLVFNANRIDVVNANEISKESLERASRDEYRSLPLWGPEIVAARLPEDKDKAREIVLAAVNGGDDVQNMPKYYLPFSEEKASVAKQSSDLGELKAYNKDRLEAVDLLINKYDGMDVGYLPVKAKSHDVVAVVDRTNGEVLEFNDFNPWK